MGTRIRLVIEILGGLGTLMALPSRYSLYIYPMLALIFTWEVFLALSKRQSISRVLIKFREKVGKVMSYFIVGSIGAVLAMSYWYGAQRIFIPKQSPPTGSEVSSSPKPPEQPSMTNSEKPPVTVTPETGRTITPSKEKETSVLDLIERYPDIDEVIKGIKSCRDLAPEAQKECIKADERLRLVAMAMKDPRFTREDIMRIMQQSTLPDMKKVFYETLTLGAVASISSESYVIYVPPEVSEVYIFLQKPEILEKGSSEILGNVSRDEFLKNWSQYVNIAKNKHMKLIIRASTEDQKQWLQNQITYNHEFLKKSKFLDPSNNKISEGVEWPLN